jgi:hypothetical protein
MIRGLVTPCEWDEKGNVIAISISSFDEEEYIIDNDKQRDRLLSLISQAVEVRGLVRYEDCRKRIRVRKCRVVKNRKNSRGISNQPLPLGE